MSHREKSPSDLIFEALCLRFRSTTNIGKTMTRQELQEATGLAPVNEDLPIHFVNHDPNQITIGPAWASRCEDMGKHA